MYHSQKYRDTETINQYIIYKLVDIEKNNLLHDQRCYLSCEQLDIEDEFH